MLKIKDNVDLIELKKFGFTKYPYDDYYRNGKIRVNSRRNIRIIAKGSPYDIEVIYDLIKADMVEKVVEDE